MNLSILKEVTSAAAAVAIVIVTGALSWLILRKTIAYKNMKN